MLGMLYFKAMRPASANLSCFNGEIVVVLEAVSFMLNTFNEI